MSSDDDEVTKARLAIGLPRDRFFDVGGGVGPGVSIVCKCIHCGTLFGSHSHDLADLDQICRGDCGRAWQHDQPKRFGRCPVAIEDNGRPEGRLVCLDGYMMGYICGVEPAEDMTPAEPLNRRHHRGLIR